MANAARKANGQFRKGARAKALKQQELVYKAPAPPKEGAKYKAAPSGRFMATYRKKRKAAKRSAAQKRPKKRGGSGRLGSVARGRGDQAIVRKPAAKTKRKHRTRSSYRSAQLSYQRPSGMRNGKRKAPYRVAGHKRVGYHKHAVTIPAHDVPERYIWAHWANPGIPDALVTMAKVVGGGILAAAAIYGTGKIVQKANLTKNQMTGALATAGTVLGAGLSLVSPAAGASVAVPLYATAIAVHTGGINAATAPVRAQGAGTATRDLITAMGEVRHLGPGGVLNPQLGEVMSPRALMGRQHASNDALEGLVRRAAG